MKTYMCILIIGICFVVCIFVGKRTSPEISYPENELLNTGMLNPNPYALFGNNAIVLMTEHECRKEHTLEILNPDRQGAFSKLELDFQTGLVKLLDEEGRVVLEKKMRMNEISRWLSTDPQADH